MVEAFGTGDAVVEIGEQLAWLSAALRFLPRKLGVAYCGPLINDIRFKNTLSQRSSVLSAPKILCRIDFTVEKGVEQLESLNGHCWHSMFRNPVVVKGSRCLARSSRSFQ